MQIFILLQEMDQYRKDQIESCSLFGRILTRSIVWSMLVDTADLFGVWHDDWPLAIQCGDATIATNGSFIMRNSCKNGGFFEYLRVRWNCINLSDTSDHG